MIEKKTSVHFIGINGSGISGVACIAKSRGFDVSGCDLNEVGDYTKQLIDREIPIGVGHSPEHLKNVDIVVLSPALLYKDKYKNIEETKIAMETRKTIKWQKFLGDYIMNKQNIVAVSGTHGKTTTTSLVGLMLERGDFDPTVFVGGVVKEWDQTYRVGDSNYYVCEGDEYDGNFLNYYPKYVVLNNLEMEHPEMFNNFDDYKNIFREFLHTVQDNGKIVFYYDDENVLDLVLSMADYFLEKNIKLIAYTFNTRLKKFPKNLKVIHVKKGNNKITINDEDFGYKLLGGHNIKNISIATIMAMEIGVKTSAIKDVLMDFSGSKRRMDLIYSDDKVKVYDDYAHHQTQINCTIQALRLNLRKDEELIVVLEPHLISRIKNNIEEYRSALLLADYSIVTKIFKSRESFMDDIDVVNLLNNEKILYIENYDDVVSTVKNIVYSSKDKKFVVLVMGAGNSYKIATKIKDECGKMK